MDSIFLSDFEQGEIGSDLFRHACLMGLDGMVSKHRETYIAAAGSGIGSRSKTGRIRRLAGFRISSETAPARVMRRFEVPEDNGFIAEWVGLRIRQKHHADRVPAGTHREDGDQNSVASVADEWTISAMQAGTTPKKRTSLNGRAALKLMRLDGARRADQAASDARVAKAGSSIAVALLLISSGASATECQSSPGHDGKWWSYRIVEL